jgi:pyruvate,water dikinase
MNTILSAKHWQHYLTRPFSIFGASLWHEWYSGDVTFEVFGVHCPDVLFIEEAKDVVRCYRPKEQIVELVAAAKNIFLDKKTCLALFDKAIQLNKRAEALLSHREQFHSFQKAVDFFIQLSVYATVLPFRMNDLPNMTFDKKVVAETEKLRKISLYPRILEEVVIPLAKKELKNAGIPATAIDYMTYKEIHNKQYNAYKERVEKQGFVYTVVDGKEEIFYEHNIPTFLSQLEPLPDTDVVKGICAYRGKVKGTVRIINQRTIQGIVFNEGDILVSVSTSPLYLPFMKIAGAIIADEGGVISHAAILSRELKKPCIIGTKNATRLLKDGDLVEVDAEKGIVRKIHSF